MTWRESLLAFHRDERGFLAGLGLVLSKILPVVSAVGSGIAAYQSITGGPTTAAAPSSLVPMLPSELARRRQAQQLYGQPTPFAITREDLDGAYYRRRRMNVLNPRALRRAIGRVKGFSRFAQRVGSYTQPGKRYRLKGFAKRAKR